MVTTKYDRKDDRMHEPRLCKAGLHDKNLPNGETKSGACRICWNEYLRNYRRQATKARRQLREIQVVLQEEQKLAAEV